MDLKIIIALIIVVIGYVYYTYFSKPSDLSIVGDDKTMILFYRPGCPYCEKIQPEWEKFMIMASKKYTNNNNGNSLKIVSVNTQEKSPLSEKYNVSGVPYIIKEHNGISTAYSGDRTAQSIFNFMISN